MKRSFNSPKGIPVNKQAAARAPADAPEIFCSSNWGAYFLKQTATPTLIEKENNLEPFFIAETITLTMINPQEAAAGKRKIVLKRLLQLIAYFLFHFYRVVSTVYIATNCFT